jgi:predicted PurR-regulated permease PerM
LKPAAQASKRRLWDRSDLSFLQKVLIVAGVAGLAAIMVKLADVLMLAFGAVLVALLLHALAAPISRHLRIGLKPALALAVLLVLGATGLVLWQFGSQAAFQLASLMDLVPRAWTDLQARLADTSVGAYLLQDLKRLEHPDGLLARIGAGVLRGASAGVATAVIVFFAGLYLAFHPSTYVGGLVRLAPLDARPRAREVIAACGEALNRWLLGQLISMVLVGVTTGLGLWAAGVHAPLALGVLAGVGQFIPVVGPGAAMIPGLLIALAQGPETLAWAAFVYIAAMQLEANVVTPLLLRQMVELPMAVTLFAVLAMGVLLGPLGVLFATPLAVMAYVLVRTIYVEGLLGDRAEPQGAAP